MLLDTLIEVSRIASAWAVPLLVLGILIAAGRARVPVYESFIVGAKEGFAVAISIIPYLVAMLVVIKVFTASGLFADIKWVLSGLLQMLGLPQFSETIELLPLALTRPLSGSGARGVLIEIYESHGPDSLVGRTASIMMGSTETTFYILTVYFGSVGIKKLRHTLPACLIADAVGIAAAVVVGAILFG
jgi:spore maturation protein B